MTEEEFFHQVGSKMGKWNGFLRKQFYSLYAEQDDRSAYDNYADEKPPYDGFIDNDFVQHVLNKTLQRCTNPTNRSHYSNFDPNRASFSTWFGWQLKGVALDVWKNRYKRKSAWEALHDGNTSVLNDVRTDLGLDKMWLI